MWRLDKCCCFLGLRKGCILIAIVDFFTNVLVLNFAETKFIGHIEQAVAICHCIGCLFLLGGALIKSNVLLMFFLITSLTNYLILIVYCVTILISGQEYASATAASCTVYICFGVYFWIVVYSFFVEIRTPADVYEV